MSRNQATAPENMEDFIDDTLPFVSIIVPMRNEEQYIGRCMYSVVNQAYPKDFMEVLVVDGMSEDLSREIVSAYVRDYPFVRLLDNPKRTTTCGLNRGISDAEGQVIARVDAHCCIEDDYVRCCVDALARTGADNVGGLMRPVGRTLLEKAIAYAMSSPFGMGSGRFHYSEEEGFVDTVYLGAYRREVFDKIGCYDELAHYGEDDELNYRLVKNGGRIFLSPKIKSHYFPRSSLSGLWKQYFRYGRGKVRTIQKHGKPASWRHLVPFLFLFAVLVNLLLSAFNSRFRWFTLGIVAAYLLSATLVSVMTCRKGGWKYLAIMPVVFGTIHLSYGFGFLVGLVRSYLLRSSERDIESGVVS